MDEKAIRYVLFSGAKNDWFMWREQFVAHASKKGYEGVLEETFTVPKKTSTPFTSAEDKLNKLVKQAYTDLILSMDPEKTASRDVFRMICRTKTAEYPYGNVTDAWKQLCEMYEPTSNLSLIGLHKQFTSATMRMKANPDLYIGYLQDIASRINDIEHNKITEKDIMMKVINTLTSEYEHVQLKLEGDFNVDKLTVDNMKTELRIKYQRMIEKLPRHDYKKYDGKEKAMAAYTKQFKGKCWKCGKIGHKGADCKNGKEEKKAKDTKPKFQGECNYCHKKGHKEADCFKKKRDEDQDQAEVAAFSYEMERELALFTLVKTTDETKKQTNDVREGYLCQPIETSSISWSEISSTGSGTMTAKEIFEKDMNGGYKWFTWNEESDSEPEDDEENEFSLEDSITTLTENETTDEDTALTIQEIDLEECLGIERMYEGELSTIFVEHQENEDEIERDYALLADEAMMIEDDEDTESEYEHPGGFCMYCGNQGKPRERCNVCNKRDATYYEDNELNRVRFTEWRKGEWEEPFDDKYLGDFNDLIREHHGLDRDAPNLEARTLLITATDIYFHNTDRGLRFVLLKTGRRMMDRYTPSMLKNWVEERHEELKKESIYEVRSIIEDIEVIMEIEWTNEMKQLLIQMASRYMLTRAILEVVFFDRDEYEEDPEEQRTAELAFVATPKIGNKKDFWIADSGASTHMGYDDAGMTDVKKIDSIISVGNGDELRATKIGDKHITIHQEDGTKVNIVLKDFKYVPNLSANLFSITKSMQQGWSLSNKGIKIILKKSGKTVMFDRMMKTGKGVIIGAHITSRVMEQANFTTATLDKLKKIDVNEFHKIVGHPSEKVMHQTAKFYNVKLEGTFKPCVECALAKSRQKNVAKVSQVKSEPGERIFFDIAHINAQSLGGSKYWLVLLDDASDYCWSMFLKKKSELSERVIPWIKNTRTKHNFKVKFMRCDNAGENLILEENCEEHGLGIIFEYTSPHSPQYNGKVERKFQTLYARNRSNLNGAQLPVNLRGLLWAECGLYSTYQENFLVRGDREKPSSNLLLDDVMHGWEAMRKFGEIGIVNFGSTSNKRAKHLNQGRACIHVGRALQRPRDTYRFFNLESRQIITSRDVRWLGITYKEYMKSQGEEIELEYEAQEEIHEIQVPEAVRLKDVQFSETDVTLDPEDDDDDPEEEQSDIKNEKESENQGEDVQNVLTNNPYAALYNGEDSDDEDQMDEFAQQQNRGRPKRILRQIEQWHPEKRRLGKTRGETRRLQEECGENVLNTSDETMEIEFEEGEGQTIQEAIEEMANVCLERKHVESYLKRKKGYAFVNQDTEIDYEKLKPVEYKHVIKLPKNYREACEEGHPWVRKKWLEAVAYEFKKLEDLKVWKKIKKSEIPEGRRCVKHKWVWAIKRDGTFRARLVACGYSQIPGVDFQDAYSPVINDVCIRILLIMILVYGYKYILSDVESAFLNGVLEEEIYMNCPEGMEGVNDTNALLLLKSIYGLVQSARVYFKTFKRAMDKINFRQSEMDPCLFIRKCNDGSYVYLAVWVDDCLIVGNDAEIQQVLKDIKKHFNITTKETLDDYLSCEILINRKKNSIWIGQPDMIKKIESKFGEWVSHLKPTTTPGPPHIGVQRPKEDEERLNQDDQKRYRSGVGALLYMVKYSRPDLSNITRELSKCMTDANEEAEKVLKRVLKFVIDTKEYGLKMEPTFPSGNEIFDWDLVVYTDADWAGDKESRKSVSGFVIFLLGCAIAWRSKQQTSVSLSSAESEYYALSEAAREIKFLVQLLESMYVKVKKPVICRIDNVGAMFMAENITTSQRSKHIDIRARFVTKMLDDKDLEIMFVKSEENLADGFTKNVNEKVFKEHTSTFVGTRNEET